jgi:hypothetical protein
MCDVMLPLTLSSLMYDLLVLCPQTTVRVGFSKNIIKWGDNYIGKTNISLI